jgi:predicted transcriptional regulator
MRSPRFLLRGFRSPRELTSLALGKLALGKLERRVLSQAWRRNQFTVRDIHHAFGHRIAYTTLMTTLDRLYRKRLLDRRKDGRAFVYRAAVSRDEFEHEIREAMIDCLLDSGTKPLAPVLASFVRAVSERDQELLDELDRLVKEKKKQLGRKQ